MANLLSSNVTRKVVRIFLDSFESSRVLTKTVNTQLLTGKFNPASGSTVDFKRPHQYTTIRTARGDISGETKDDIEAGKATGTVQDYFTASVDFDEFEEALELDQLESILDPMATQIVTDLEVDLGRFMVDQLGQTHGTVGTQISAWSDVAGARSLLRSVGVPQNERWYYAMAPFAEQNLADKQTQLAPGSSDLVDSAWEQAVIARPFAGMTALASNALSTMTTGDTADRAGTLAATPDGTYATAKDTMQQVLSLTGLTIGGTINPGDVLEFDGTGALARSKLNISTRQVALDGVGAAIPWRCTVVEGVTLDGAGAGVITVASAAINEATTRPGQYDNISVALTSGDSFTILGAADTTIQPNLFYHPQAVGVGTVKLKKLFSTDTVFTTKDGFSIRMSKYSDGDANRQKVRFDLLPAFACFNPNFGGHGWG